MEPEAPVQLEEISLSDTPEGEWTVGLFSCLGDFGKCGDEKVRHRMCCSCFCPCVMFGKFAAVRIGIYCLMNFETSP